MIDSSSRNMHSTHGVHVEHTGHDVHADHSVAMFRGKFWGAAAVDAQRRVGLLKIGTLFIVRASG
jgi:hypothetical protein